MPSLKIIVLIKWIVLHLPDWVLGMAYRWYVVRTVRKMGEAVIYERTGKRVRI